MTQAAWEMLDVLETEHWLWAAASDLALGPNLVTLSWLLACLLGQVIWDEKGSDEALGASTFVDVYTLKPPLLPSGSKQRLEYCCKDMVQPLTLTHVSSSIFKMTLMPLAAPILSTRVRCHVCRRTMLTQSATFAEQHGLRLYQIHTLGLCLRGCP